VLEDVGLLNARLMGGHCIYVTEADRRMAAAGAHAVHIPKCNASIRPAGADRRCSRKPASTSRWPPTRSTATWSS
jgi:cytosine/adenosine deaminase-related metal-dependent hydrolase